MSEITTDQYRVSALLDTVADNAKRCAAEVVDLKLAHAVEIQELKQALASAQSQIEQLSTAAEEVEEQPNDVKPPQDA